MYLAFITPGGLHNTTQSPSLGNADGPPTGSHEHADRELFPRAGDGVPGNGMPSVRSFRSQSPPTLALFCRTIYPLAGTLHVVAAS